MSERQAGQGGFTPEQHHALGRRNVDACVVAGPGSGKTTVLVERFRKLIEEDAVDPRAIVAITFTEKAAANMRVKLLDKFAHDEVRRRELETAWVSTIHGFCTRLLRENAIAAGIDPQFRVLDQRDAERAQADCIHKALNELTERRREDTLALIEALAKPVKLAADLRDAWDVMRSAGLTAEAARRMEDPARVDVRATPRVLREMMARWGAKISEAQERQRGEIFDWAATIERAGDEELIGALVSFRPRLNAVPKEWKAELEDFREEHLPQLISAAVSKRFARFRTMLFDVLAQFEELYAERKRENGELDFNDLERCAIELLRDREEVRGKVRREFRHIMLDEFQDINAQQEQLIRLVRAPDTFFGVGDINQSIYGFRHAQPQIFLDYEKEVREAERHSAELSHNFRSREAILRLVETLLNKRAGITERRLTAGGTFHEKDGASIEVLRIEQEDFEAAAEENEEEEGKGVGGNREARWIANRVARLKGTLRLGRTGDRVADFRDFAILCRTSGPMRAILEALDEAGIPWVCGRRESFLVSREGRDNTALLRAVANPRDGIALATVLRSPLCGLSDEGLLRLRLQGGSVTEGMEKFARGEVPEGMDAEDTRKLGRFAGNLGRWRESEPVIAADLLIARALTESGIAWVPGTPEGDNVASYLQLARSRGEGRDLQAFLHEVELAGADLSKESELADRDQGNRVQVMTAHASKGLEFPVVILAAMGRGTGTDYGGASFTLRHGLGVKWMHAEAGVVKDSWQIANAAETKQREQEEMHRLLYVAMTRAEEHLILSYSLPKRGKPANWARMVEELLDLDERPARNDFEEEVVATDGDDVAVALLTADVDPPLVIAGAGAEEAAREVLTVPLAEAEGQYDSGVNVTSLTLFAACPRRYYLERYTGWSGGRAARFDQEDLAADLHGEDDGTPAAELGSMVHAVLAEKPGEYPEEAVALAAVFTRSELGARAKAATRAEREWDFIVDLDGMLVRGSIDLWFEQDGAIHVVDYKTDDVVAGAAAGRASRYTPQLALYAVAIRRAFGREVASASLHFLRPDVVVKVPLPEDAEARVRGWIGQLREAQEQQRFELRESADCAKCPHYGGLCPAGRL